MEGYKDLEIYKESKGLAIAIHNMSFTLPKFELYEEGRQIRRSSKAVTAAIVERYRRRRYKADFIKFLIYAQTEDDEIILHLNFLYKTKTLNEPETYNKLEKEYEALSKRINTFIKWVEDNWNNFDKPKPVSSNL